MNLNESYSREGFLTFLNDFLPDFKSDIRPIVIPSAVKSIAKAYQLGASSKLDITVYELEHDGSLDKRVALATDGFRIMKDAASFQALVIYRTSSATGWRLSLMTATPEIDASGKIITKLSNPRRYSFSLGPEAKVQTPTKFLIQKGTVTDFSDLQSRFSVEVVNKEFYAKIALLYTELVGGIRGEAKKSRSFPGLMRLPSVAQHSEPMQQFAVRLIGRLVFCWFLREKKSDSGQPLIPHKLLSIQAAQGEKDYYHAILEPLFFEVLNKQTEARRERFTEDPFESIPYLNGGLFSPQEDDYYSHDEDKQVINHNLVSIPDEWINSFFEVLEQYNFTVDENTSSDIDLSIDPEMLGRIFENLLAEINPETGESARKSTGSYYTPRQIVDYMVDQSLLAYIEEKTDVEKTKLVALISYDLTDDTEYPLSPAESQSIINALSSLTVLDPACGSGAFPIGILQKIVFILQRVDPNAQLWFEQQLQGAPPEVRRLIEREFAYKNFDYIRKLGVIRQSIYGVDIQPIATEIARLRCFLTLVVDERIDDTQPNRGIEPLPNLDFKFVTANSLLMLPGSSEHGQLQMFEDTFGIEELKSLRAEYFSASNVERDTLKLRFVQAQNKMFQRMLQSGGFAELTKELSAWDPFSHKVTDWFDSEWMFGVSDGFDVLIANPPYGGEITKTDQAFFVKHYKAAYYKVDTYALFMERGLSLLKSRGCLVYIVPYTWTTVQQFAPLRAELLLRDIKFIINLPKKIFMSADLDTTIFLIKNLPPSSESISVGKTDGDVITIEGALSTSFILSSEGSQINMNLTAEDIPLINKIRKSDRRIADNFIISQGLIPYDKYRGHSEVDIKNRVWHANHMINSDYKIELRGQDVSRFSVNTESGLFIKYGEHLAAPRDKKFFTSPRILVREITRGGISASYAEEELYNTPVIINIIHPTNNRSELLLLLGLLNSKLFYYFHKKTHSKANAQTSIPKILVEELRNSPFIDNAKSNSDASAKIVGLVDDLLTKKSEDPNSDCTEEEAKVDELIYELYGLSSQEISLVEGVKE